MSNLCSVVFSTTETGGTTPDPIGAGGGGPGGATTTLGARGGRGRAAPQKVAGGGEEARRPPDDGGGDVGPAELEALTHPHRCGIADVDLRNGCPEAAPWLLVRVGDAEHVEPVAVQEQLLLGAAAAAQVERPDDTGPRPA